MALAFLCVAFAACSEGRLEASSFDALERKAGGGDSEAQEEIALCYLHGRGASQSFTKAAQWFAHCAKAGRPLCQYHLGLLFELGQGVPISDSNAGSWYKKAIGHENADAMYRLGRLYRLGQGVVKSSVKAYAWFSLAAKKDHLESVGAVKELEEHMGTSTLARSKALAAEWEKSGPQY